MPLTHLGCPACGGTLSLAEGQRIVSCRYCGGENLVLIPDAIPRHAVALGVARDAARAAAQQFLTGPALPRVLRERGRIQDLSLFYVPFYEFTGTRLGTFLLREDKKAPPLAVGDGGPDPEFQRWLQEPSETKEDTRVIQQEFVRIGPACDLTELGVDQIHLESMRRGANSVALEPYDLVALQGRAVVFAPTKPPARFTDESQLRIRVRSDHTGVVEQRLKILYYPVWQARYRHAGRQYEIAVDGVTGTVLRARAPMEIRQAAAMTVVALGLAALCFGRPTRQLLQAGLAGGAASGWFVGMLGVLLTLMTGGVAALFLGWMGWMVFRQGGDVVLGEETTKAVPAPDWNAGAFEGMRTWLAEWLLGFGTRPRGKG